MGARWLRLDPATSTLAAVAAGFLAMASCDFPTNLAETEVSAEARESDQLDANTDSASASAEVGDAIAEASASSNSQSGIVSFTLEVGSPDSEAEVFGTHYLCLKAIDPGELSVSAISPASFRITKDCTAATGGAEFDFTLSVQAVDEPPQILVAAEGSVFCPDADVTLVNLDPCSEPIPDARFDCPYSETYQDVVQFSVDDEIRLILDIHGRAFLPAGAGEFENIELGGAIQFSKIGPALEVVPCTNPCNCDDDTDCSGPEICIECSCVEPMVPTALDLAIDSQPDSIDPGSLVSVFSIDANLPAGRIIPYRMEFRVDGDALDLNGPLVANTVVGFCNGYPLIVDDVEGTMFIDTNGNGVADAADVLVEVNDGAELTVEATMPSNPPRILAPADLAVGCDFQSLFMGGLEGEYDVTTLLVGFDPDTRGADDGEGTPPPEHTFHSTLTIGDPAPVSCGDAAGAQAPGARGAAPPVTASDALFILRAAVGSLACVPCVCDVDSGGTVVASDALMVLRFAVGQPVVLDCPACD